MKFNRVKKYLIFMKSGMLEFFAYRGVVFLFMLGSVITAVLMGLVWWAIFSFSPTPTINGYSYPQMLMYVIMSTMIGELIFSDTFSVIADDVSNGVIGMRLMKPVNYRIQLCCTAIGNFIVRFGIFFVPLVAAGTLTAVFGFGLEGIKWYNILLFIPAVFLAMLFKDTLAFIFGQLTFKTQAGFGVSIIFNTVTNFLSGALVPLALFPNWAQTVLAYTPFPSMISMPVQLFLGMLDWRQIAIAFATSVGWLAVLSVIAHLLFKLSVRHVVVFGG